RRQRRGGDGEGGPGEGDGVVGRRECPLGDRVAADPTRGRRRRGERAGQGRRRGPGDEPGRRVRQRWHRRSVRPPLPGGRHRQRCGGDGERAAVEHEGVVRARQGQRTLRDRVAADPAGGRRGGGQRPGQGGRRGVPVDQPGGGERQRRHGRPVHLGRRVGG